jgi:hypothetical protein
VPTAKWSRKPHSSLLSCGTAIRPTPPTTAGSSYRIYRPALFTAFGKHSVLQLSVIPVTSKCEPKMRLVIANFIFVDCILLRYYLLLLLLLTNFFFIPQNLTTCFGPYGPSSGDNYRNDIQYVLFRRFSFYCNASIVFKAMRLIYWFLM